MGRDVKRTVGQNGELKTVLAWTSLREEQRSELQKETLYSSDLTHKKQRQSKTETVKTLQSPDKKSQQEGLVTVCP